MKIEYFKEILVLARVGNYMAAADGMNLSQSTLSRHVMELEKYFGIEVFDRSRKRIRITEEGEILLTYAERISNLYEDFGTSISLANEAAPKEQKDSGDADSSES